MPFRPLPHGRIEQKPDPRATRDRSLQLRSESPFPEDEPVRILVTGAAGFLGRYTIHALCSLLPHIELTLIGTDRQTRPLYLNQAPYRSVIYDRCDLDAPSSSAHLIGQYRPHLVVAAAGPSRHSKRLPSDEVLHQIHVTHRLQLARELGQLEFPTRLVQFTSGRYQECPEGSPATEEDALDLSDPFTSSLFAAEEALQQLESSHPMLCTSLRLPTLFGPGDRGVPALLTRAFSRGLLPLNVPEPKRLHSLLWAGDAAWAAVRAGFCSESTIRAHPVLNIAPSPIQTGDLISTIAQNLQPRGILGLSSPLARLFDLSHLKEFKMPNGGYEILTRVVQTVEGLGESIQDIPIPLGLNKEVLRFLLRDRPIDGRRFERIFEMSLPAPYEPLATTTRYLQESRWKDLAPPISASRERLSRRRQIEAARKMTRQLAEFRPTLITGPPPTVHLPIIDLEIDLKSLYILSERMQDLTFERILGAGFRTFASRVLPNLARSSLQALQAGLHDAHRNRFAHPGGPTLTDLRTLFEGPGPLAGFRQNLQSQLLLDTLERLRDSASTFRPLLQLLPELDYGFLLETELGPVGIVLSKREEDLVITFPRDIVDDLPTQVPARRRLAEFRKNTRTDVSFTLPLAALASDLTRPHPLRRVLSGMGTVYLTTGVSRFYRLIGEEIFEESNNRIYYLDNNRQILFGIAIDRDSSMQIIGEEAVEHLNRVLHNLYASADLSATLERISGGHIKPRFENIVKTRRLLRALFHPGPVQRLLGLLERRQNIRRRGRTNRYQRPRGSR